MKFVTSSTLLFKRAASDDKISTARLKQPTMAMAGAPRT
jgi:hypothetical protein